MSAAPYQHSIEPVAVGLKAQAWGSGAFSTGHRSYTARVEGRIRSLHNIVMVTLRGHARHLDVATECGHRYSGSDRPGTVSFVPAHCTRSFTLTGVDAEWVSIALCPSVFAGADAGQPFEVPAFSNVEDGFVAALAAELAWLHRTDGRLDPVYCQVMGAALSHHLQRRHGHPRIARLEVGQWRIAPARLRRVLDYIEANLAHGILVDELATLAGLSAGYFHRAFKATMGQTPVGYINGRRVDRATRMILDTDDSLASIGMAVGFASPSHFARVFRQVTGRNPSAGRTDL